MSDIPVVVVIWILVIGISFLARHRLQRVVDWDVYLRCLILCSDDKVQFVVKLDSVQLGIVYLRGVLEDIGVGNQSFEDWLVHQLLYL